jgi:membrane protein
LRAPAPPLAGGREESATFSQLENLWARAHEQLWSREPLRPAPLAWLRGTIQLAIVIGEGFVKDQLLLRAHSLTYLTLLSLIPLLALAVSLFELLGSGRERMMRLLVQQFAAGAPAAVDKIIEYVESLNFGALGTVGGSILIGTTVLTLGNVERSLNAIWGVKHQRPWVRRIPDYFTVVLISPLLLGLAISLGTSLESQWLVQRILANPLGATFYDAGLRQAPTLLMILGFAFLYWFMPNTSVRVPSALLGGLVAGLLFVVAQKLYLQLSVGVARYDAIFGGLAVLPLLMVWMYFSWAIALLGAEVAYAHQTLPLFRREVRGAPAGPAAREAIGLGIALLIARAFRGREAPWDEEGLSDALDVPLRTVRDVTAHLEKAGLISPVEVARGHGAYQPSRPLASIQVAHVLDALRGPREAPLGVGDVAARVDAVLDAIDKRRHEDVGIQTLEDLLESTVDPGEPGQ